MSTHTKRKITRHWPNGRERTTVRAAVRPTGSVRRTTHTRRPMSVKKVSRSIQQKSRKSIARHNSRHVRERQTNWDEIAKSKTLKKRMGERLKHSGTAKVGRHYVPSRVKKTSIQNKSRKKVTLRNNAHSVQKTRTTASRRVKRPSTAKRHASTSSRVSMTKRKRKTSDSERKVMVKKLSELQLVSLLGEGAFSRVYLAMKKKGNEKQAIALKVTPLKQQIGAVVSEGRVLQELRHPMIVGFHGAFRDKGYYCVVLDLTLGGELLFHFERAKHGRLDWNVAQFYCSQLVCVLDYMHSRGWIYRDLKPENILLDKKGNVKLVDFGFAKQLKGSEKCTTLCGSKEYVAPEVLSGLGYSHAADVWSLGVLLFELTVGHLPYDTQSANPRELRHLITNSRISFPPFVSSFAKSLIKKMLIVNPKKRATIKQIKRHASMSNVDWKAVQQLKYTPPIVPRLKHQYDTSNYESAHFEEPLHSTSFQYVDSLLDKQF